MPEPETFYPGEIDPDDPRARKAATDDDRIDNPDDCPLFPHANKRTTKVLGHIQVHKDEAGGRAFKGKAPINADQAYIAKRWGNGDFFVEGCTSKGVVKKTATLTISLNAEDLALMRGEKSANGNGQPQTSTEAFMIERLKADFSTQQRHAEQVEKLATKAADQVIEQGRQFTDTVKSTHEHQMQRDREYHKEGRESSQAFLASILKHSTDSHAQAMEQQRISHQQAMEQHRESNKHMMMFMQAAHERSLKANDPTLLLGILQQGFQMGQGVDNDDPSWLKAVDKGGDMLKSLATMSKAPRLPRHQHPAFANPQGKRLPARASQPNPSEEPEDEEEYVLDDEEVEATERFKLLCEKKGVGYPELLQNAWDEVSALPDKPNPNAEPPTPDTPTDVDNEESDEQRSAEASPVEDG
jgi:hypothetical protein